jgi:hypothetical protein
MFIQRAPTLKTASGSRSTRRARLGAILAAAALSLALAGPVAADATVTRGTVITPILETGLPDDCRPDVTGTLIGIDTVRYQTVEAPQGFHVVATVVDTGQIAWSDGTYTVIESVDHQTFVDTGSGTTVATVAHEDSGNLYSADGVFLSRVTFHVVERFTVSDGTLRVAFELGRLHFFGGC